MSGRWRGRLVAIKVLRAAFPGDAAAELDSFRREVRVLSSLQHDRIVGLLGALPLDIYCCRHRCASRALLLSRDACSMHTWQQTLPECSGGISTLLSSLLVAAPSKVANCPSSGVLSP